MGERPQPVEQFAECEWLGEVVVGARVEPSKSLIVLSTAAEHDDWCPVTRLAQPPTDDVTVRIRQPHVEHDDVVQPVRKHRARAT